MAPSGKYPFDFDYFLKSRRILILDDDTESRGVLLAHFCHFGSRREFIEMAEGAQISTPDQYTNRFDIVFASQLPKEPFSPRTRASVILVWTPKVASPADLALAAELGFHGTLFKPYSKGRLQSAMDRIVTSRAANEHYLNRVGDAIALRSDGFIDEASEVLRSATELHARPAVALTLLAEIEKERGKLTEARAYLKRSLEANAEYLRSLCLIADWERESGKYSDAYELYLKIFERFPIEPKRLETLLSLAVTTQSYEDISAVSQLSRYNLATTKRSQRALVSALAVAGKAFLKNGRADRAFENFDRAATMAGDFTAPLLYAVETLFEFGHSEEAGRIMNYFPEGLRSDPRYLRVRYTYLSMKQPAGEEFQRLKLLFEGTDPGILPKK